jgi:hypothetical protein
MRMLNLQINTEGYLRMFLLLPLQVHLLEMQRAGMEVCPKKGRFSFPTREWMYTGDPGLAVFQSSFP